MKIHAEKHFYLFKGDWYDIFSRLNGAVPAGNEKRFAVWVPVDKSKEYNLVIVYGVPLPEKYCLVNNIWKTHQQIFEAFYLPKIKEYCIHSNSKSVPETKNAFTISLTALPSGKISHY